MSAESELSAFTIAKTKRFQWLITQRLSKLMNLKVTPSRKARARLADKEFGCFSYHGYSTGRAQTEAVPFDACQYCARSAECYQVMVKNAKMAFPEISQAWDDCLERAKAQGGGLTLAREFFKVYAGLPMTLAQYLIGINAVEGMLRKTPGTGIRSALKHREKWEV